MRVLVTGATGFVGAWTAKAVHEHGHQLRLLVRDCAKLTPIAAALGFDASDVVIGDMTDADRVGQALTGCDAVIHAAAVVSFNPDDTEPMMNANLAGATNVIGQAVAAGIDPVVYVSSWTALWHPGITLVHAELPLRGGSDGYATSKTRVEHYVRELQDRGAPIAITYPCTVIGPGADGQYGESGDVMASFARTGIPGRGTGLTIIDVRDVAEAHARLLTPGHGPRRYVLGGHHVDGKTLAAELTRITGRRVRHIAIPDAVLLGAGKLADRYRRRLPPSMAKLSAAGIRYLVAPPADNTPAEQDLAIAFRPPRQALEALLDDRARRHAARAARSGTRT
ncbi:oxidoreductase [Mycobacterium kubicae]|uniref:NAD-dependent epimerase/dehydratase family protein n=1 Tax=Mycobacterium kubicae TaxID=120959 RepID=A0AAX1JA67_9MYCO|nr:NAD-dependent epimerase/dehydratase family protein [Mycobacterium kubicae]MCV7094273.1 NAD-dependent epimerase/dehydratase family protein [Mycobacterium kubicae]ORV98929.1 epimerase [Mycobacterium kubicae]QNI09921.1 NAD-dependent epimerase/dehydratase family protein [Mycobacterium kubicae]QPI38117.1 NAD-dependent epimerase/dehydratase family protein [Mycobacterium kubicae]GFG65532.1 oxidoreductase [Mycobacterium kubicae]